MSDLGFTVTFAKNKVLVYRNGRHCGTFTGEQAQRIRELASDQNTKLQQLLARLTGNYQRGNERRKRGNDGA